MGGFIDHLQSRQPFRKNMIRQYGPRTAGARDLGDLQCPTFY